MPFPRSYGALGSAAALAAALLGAACSSHRPAATTARPPANPSLQALQTDLAQTLGGQEDGHASWAVLVQSLATGETLYRLNSQKLMMPASNMKIVTLAAAAERLGWDYRFETTLLTGGHVAEDGTLDGDLIVRGSGDPSLGTQPESATPVLASWADTLWQNGIRRITGSIIGDDNAFDDETLGAGWAWDYLGYGYAAPVGALQYREDVADLLVRPGQIAGGAATLELRPAECGLDLINRLLTVPAGGTLSVDLRRLPGSSRLEVTGSVPLGTPEFTEEVAVDNPTEYFARALRSALIARGIDVIGPAIDIDTLPAAPDTSGAHVLMSYLSPPLSDLAGVLMKLSQNLYADSLLKTLGRREGIGTAEGGRRVVREVLESWGLNPDDLVMYDGSGLSRYNYVTADLLVGILRHLYTDPRHRDASIASLPVAGQDGTLAHRFNGTRADGKVVAKTGSIANVRSLSGYVRSGDGEWLVFSILANHFNIPQASIDDMTDRIVERLTVFER